MPSHYHKLGSVQGPLIRNYIYTGFWIFFGKILQKFDLQQINGTYPNCVRSKHTAYHYHGSEIRLGTVKPKNPSFVSLKELLKYSTKSVFLPRCADPLLFAPDEIVKEEKEKFKDEKGYDYVVGHFAPSPNVKGSNLIEEAINLINIEQECKIHFINQSYPREKMPEILNSCDLVVDHVNPQMGSTYNVISIESLFCEVPVACYYNEDIDFEEMKSYVSYLDPKPEEMKENIKEILKDIKTIDRNKIMKYHHPRIVTDKLLLSWDEWGYVSQN